MFFGPAATLNLVNYYTNDSITIVFDEVGIGGTSFLAAKNNKVSDTVFEFNTNNNASVIVKSGHSEQELINLIYAVDNGNVHNTPVTKGKFYYVKPSVTSGEPPTVSEIQLGTLSHNTLINGLYFGISAKPASNGYSCASASVYNLNISSERDTAASSVPASNSRAVDAKAELAQDGTIDVAVSAQGKFSSVTSYCC